MRVAILLVLGVLAIFATGREGAARLALSLHLPSLTLHLTQDHELRGLALFQRGAFADAAEALRLAGSRGAYNRGTSLARTGDYTGAVMAFDAVLARDPAHADARANRAILIKLIPSETEKGGGNRPQGDREGEKSKTENKNQSMTLLEAEEAQRQRAIQVMRPMESKAMIADEQWLAAMADEPGRYLKLRIAAEYARRREAGLSPPPGGDPW